MKIMYTKLIVICTLFCQTFSSGIPIWELLTYQEKVGNLTFVFMDLVNLYCKKSTIPDCGRVLTLYGVSNLLQEDESTLDLLDPHHWNSRRDLWRVAMNGAFEFPYDKQLELGHPGHFGHSGNFENSGHSGHANSQKEVENDLNTISNSADMDNNFPSFYDYEADVEEPHPYAVKVAPPPNFQHTPTYPSNNGPVTSSPNKEFSIGNQSQSQSQTRTQTQSRKQDESKYIVLLPHGSRFEESTSGRSRNSRFQDFRPRSVFKEQRSVKKYSENLDKPSKSLLYTILKK